MVDMENHCARRSDFKNIKKKENILFLPSGKKYEEIFCSRCEKFFNSISLQIEAQISFCNLLNSRELIKLPTGVCYCKTTVLMMVYGEKNSNSRVGNRDKLYILTVRMYKILA